MDIRAAEISAILKEQIKNFGQEAEVSEASLLAPACPQSAPTSSPAGNQTSTRRQPRCSCGMRSSTRAYSACRHRVHLPTLRGKQQPN